MIDQDAVVEARRMLGRRLAAYRHAAGLSQHQLADAVHYGRSSIANVETGRQNVSREFWQQCDTITHADGALVSAYDQQMALTRRLLGNPPPEPGPGSVAAGSPRVDLEQAGLDPLDVIQQRRRDRVLSNVDEARLRYLEASAYQFINDNERLPPGRLVPRARSLRRFVDDLLDGHQHPPQRARLYTVAAYLSGLLGALALDSGSFQQADAYGTEAFELADAVGQPDLQAWARAAQSLIAYYSGDYHSALAYARDGQQRSPGSTQSVRLAVNGEARALARLGDSYGVDEAVHRPFTALPDTSSQSSISTSLAIDAYCPARTAANAATAYLVPGCAEQADTYAKPAVDAFDRAGLSGPQALSRIDLATAALLYDEPEVERACSLIDDALAITAEQRFESVHQRTVEFLATARPWSEHRSVREVAALVADRRASRPPLLS